MDKNLAREKKKRLIITFETTTAPLKLDIKGKACGIPGRTIPLPSVISKNGLLKENLKMMLSVGSIILVKSHLKLQYNIQENIVRHIWI